MREAHYGEQNPLELNFMPVMDEDQPAKTVLEQERERLRRTKPKLSDDEKVAALVEYAMHLDGGEVEQLYLEAFSDGIPADFLGPISPAERELERKRKERVAILEARSGRFDELVALLCPLLGPDVRRRRWMADLLGPLSDLERSRRWSVTLPGEAWSLIANRLLTGKRSGPGRPPMTNDERRIANPVHDASASVPDIERVLCHYYSEYSKREIREAAVEVAARIARIGAETLIRHRRRGKDDKRRLRRE